jgi:hypothetical protein
VGVTSEAEPYVDNEGAEARLILGLVIPAKAGIHVLATPIEPAMDSRLRGSDEPVGHIV